MNQRDIKPLIEKYTLLENQHDWILKNIIFPRFLENATPALKPRLILKTGQCGAGKSCASQLIASTFAKDIVPVDFSTDMLRHIHPKCDEIRREHYHDYDILLKKDAYQWQKELLNAAMKRRANIIFEKVLTEINDWNLPLFTEARKNGYEIECVAMGVHSLQSLAGMYYRREKEYLDDHAHLLIPIPKEKHDLCYEKLPFILKKMETFKTVDIISIYNRDLTFKWSKDLKKDEVKQNISFHQLSLIDALNFSRQSFRNNPTQIQITYNHLETARLLMQQRNSETLKIQVVDDIKKELTHFLGKDSQPDINNKGNEK